MSEGEREGNAVGRSVGGLVTNVSWPATPVIMIQLLLSFIAAIVTTTATNRDFVMPNSFLFALIVL